MKRCLLLFFSITAILTAQSQTLFTYGKYSVTKAEFEQAYNKNKAITAGHPTSLEEYLTLYINFKLKVQAARDLQLDTLPDLQAELQNFRSQIEEFYLRDERVVNQLSEEAFERSQKDIHLIDYFIALPNGADTAIYYEAANNLYQQLSNGKFHVLSGVASPVKTDVGLITVFTVPYSFETIIYGLKPGTYSKPRRVTEGWHIFFNAGEYKPAGEIEIAQILISAPSGDKNERKRAGKLADSLYSLLKKGADFTDLAIEYSHDRTSFFNGGLLPAFGRGKFEKDFEQKAFSIQNNGDILKPFETEFGFHILKRISSTDVPASKEDSFMNYLALKISKDSRMEIAKEAFAKKIRVSTGLEQTKFDSSALWVLTDSALLANRNIMIGGIDEETVLLRFSDKSIVQVKDWTQYLRNSNISLTGNIKSNYPTLIKEFSDTWALNNYRNRLATFSPEFNAQLQEFSDGNLLFEVMERKIWSKATEDTPGLQNYYIKNREKYLWDESADALLFFCSNEMIADKVKKDLANGKTREAILAENGGLLQIDSGRYEFHQIPIQAGDKLIVNKIAQFVHNTLDGSVVFSKILKIYPAKSQRSFEESRGMVINDYQDVLEKEWINELRKKYPVRVNENILKSITK